MEMSEKLRRAGEDLTELEGKQIELLREKTRLNTHKQVFLAELERINEALDIVNGSLEDIAQQYSNAWWHRTRLRLTYFFQLFFQCLNFVGTCLAFLSVNLLYMLYFVLSAASTLARTILDCQVSSLSGKNQRLDDSLSWS